MDQRTSFGPRVAVGVIVLLASACSGGPAPEPADVTATAQPGAATTPVPARGPTARPLVDPGAVRSAVDTLQDFLDEWAAHGVVAASRYLVPAERASSDSGTPRILSGRVRSHQVTRWHGAYRFTFTATMRIRFDGPRYAWDRGPEQSRFVTAHRLADGSYLLSLATSP